MVVTQKVPILNSKYADKMSTYTNQSIKDIMH